MVTNVTPRDLKARIDAGEKMMIIDVREDWEVMAAKIEGSIHIPMNDIPDALDRIPKDSPVVIMCHHGSRSMQVAYWLRMQGYMNIINLMGGIDRWAREVDPDVARY